MTAQLHTLLRLRQYEVDRCQSRLAAAILHEQSLADRLPDFDRQLAQQRAELSTLTRQGQLNINALRLRHRQVQLLTAQRSLAQAEFQAASLVTQQQRAVLIAADQRRQVVEKLRARLLDELQTHRQRTAARELEEAWRPKS